MNAHLEEIPSSAVLHSRAELTSFDGVLRVGRFYGFEGPEAGTPRPLPIARDSPQADVVVLDDANNGFRDSPRSWPSALRRSGARPLVVLKSSRPLATGRLWELVSARHADRLVVVLSADDLRAEGLNISRRLSWERTATDCAWQIASNPALIALGTSAHLVVRFGFDGALHYARDGTPRARLYYDPGAAEGDYEDAHLGTMVGVGAAFVAGLTARLARQGLSGVGSGIGEGLLASRRLLRSGFGADRTRLAFPTASAFRASDDDRPLAQADVPIEGSNPDEPDPGYWRILGDTRGSTIEDMARRIVLFGEAPEQVPLARFGALRTIDRAEIESYRSIRNVLLEYVKTDRPRRPLSIAVFGPPGSGKSFGVTQVATSISGHVEPIEFNVAQWVTRDDFVAALHKVRDTALTGAVPLVFFDEFDAPYDGPLGWLKHFLAPMQDGEFRDAGAVHPVGKCVFVFAGGTCSTYREFAHELGSETLDQHRGFRAAKGPDFVSRLRGYVNVRGPNRFDDDDKLFMIRRAMLLRSQLELDKSLRVVDGEGRAHVDEGVLRAFLGVPRYKHGARSMEAIIDMSTLRGRRSYEQADLPPKEQLEPHVDTAETFLGLVVRDVLLGAHRQRIAKAIHEKRRRDQKDTLPDDDPSMAPWEELSEELRRSNYDQADDIPAKLRAIRFGFWPVQERMRPPRLTQSEIEVLARREHERWVLERRAAGWTFGSKRDHARRTSPYLVPWSRLAQSVKEQDRDAVRGLPEYMADAGFALFRLPEYVADERAEIYRLD